MNDTYDPLKLKKVNEFIKCQNEIYSAKMEIINKLKNTESEIKNDPEIKAKKKEIIEEIEKSLKSAKKQAKEISKKYNLTIPEPKEIPDTEKNLSTQTEKKGSSEKNPLIISEKNVDVIKSWVCKMVENNAIDQLEKYYNVYNNEVFKISNTIQKFENRSVQDAYLKLIQAGIDILSCQATDYDKIEECKTILNLNDKTLEKLGLNLAQSENSTVADEDQNQQINNEASELVTSFSATDKIMIEIKEKIMKLASEYIDNVTAFKKSAVNLINSDDNIYIADNKKSYRFSDEQMENLSELIEHAMVLCLENTFDGINSEINNYFNSISKESSALKTYIETIVSEKNKKISASIPKSPDINTIPQAPPLGTIPQAPPLGTIPQAPPLGTIPQAPPLGTIPQAPAAVNNLADSTSITQEKEKIVKLARDNTKSLEDFKNKANAIINASNFDKNELNTLKSELEKLLQANKLSDINKIANNEFFKNLCEESDNFKKFFDTLVKTKKNNQTGSRPTIPSAAALQSVKLKHVDPTKQSTSSSVQTPPTSQSNKLVAAILRKAEEMRKDINPDDDDELASQDTVDKRIAYLNKEFSVEIPKIKIAKCEENEYNRLKREFDLFDKETDDWNDKNEYIGDEKDLLKSFLESKYKKSNSSN